MVRLLLPLFIALASGSAFADGSMTEVVTAAPGAKPERLVHAFFGLALGADALSVNHPLLTGRFAAPGFSASAGIQFKKVWSFSAELGSASQYVKRQETGGRFAAASAGAECLTCKEKLSNVVFSSGNVAFVHVGPRVDFSPFGDSGPFASAGGGASTIQGIIGESFGGYVVGRLGFRYRVAKTLEVSAEGGFQADWLNDARTTKAFGNALVRFYFN